MEHIQGESKMATPPLLDNMKTEINNNEKNEKIIIDDKSNIMDAEINNNEIESKTIMDNASAIANSKTSNNIKDTKMEIEDTAQEQQSNTDPGKYCYNLADDIWNVYRMYRTHSISFDAVLCTSSFDDKNALVYVHCHQSLLAASSPFFKAMLNNTDLKKKKSLFIHLPYINEKDAYYILDYIYNAKVFVPRSDLVSFLSAASKLQIRGIHYEENANEKLSSIGTNVIKSENIIYNANNELALHLYNQGTLNSFNCDSLDQKSSNFENDILGELKKEPYITQNKDTNRINDFANSCPTNETCNQSSKKGMKTEKTQSKKPKMAKDQTTDNGKIKPKAEKTGKINSKADAKPENSEASNAVYKEWKGKFSSKASTDNGDQFNCHQCQEVKSFTLDSSLRRHYKQTHEKQCKCCKLPFYDDDALKIHMVENHEFKCALCEKTFTLKSSLRRHHEKAHEGTVM